MCRTWRRCESKLGSKATSIASNKRALRKHKAGIKEALNNSDHALAYKHAHKAIKETKKLADNLRNGNTVATGGTKHSYGGSHEAPTNDGYSQPLTGAGTEDWSFPPDFLENPDWYAGEHEETLQQIKKIINGGKQVTIYRALPKGERVISDGDWVALSKEYAEYHAYRESDDDTEYEVVQATVPAWQVYTDGNSLEEWGFDSRTREVADFWREYDPSEQPENTPTQNFLGDKPSEPLTFPFMRNPTSLSTNQASNHYFGQDIEPAGRYMSQRHGDFTPDGWESGEITFQKPLYLLEGGNYEEESNWKQRLNTHYGVAGKKLSEAIRADGYDAIVTYSEKYGIGEVVDLTGE